MAIRDLIQSAGRLVEDIMSYVMCSFCEISNCRDIESEDLFFAETEVLFQLRSNDLVLNVSNISDHVYTQLLSSDIVVANYSSLFPADTYFKSFMEFDKENSLFALFHISDFENDLYVYSAFFRVLFSEAYNIISGILKEVLVWTSWSDRLNDFAVMRESFRFFLWNNYDLEHTYSLHNRYLVKLNFFELDFSSKTREEIAKSMNMFTCDSWPHFSWSDEMLHSIGYDSMDLWDMNAMDSGLFDFVNLLIQIKKSNGAWQADDFDATLSVRELRIIEMFYLSQTSFCRLYMPRPFTAAPYYNGLNIAWFLDFAHLAWWFFFFASFVLVMWLVIAGNIFSRNIEARQPVRETRGFSRAQTGDAVTAVLPMTWSITMLMHASTHSVNFDENTTGTTFMVTVMAYQWGWNYYYPRDIVSILWTSPKLVGHGQSVALVEDQYYDYLLEHQRQDFIKRQSNGMRYSNKQGKNLAPNIISIFLRTPFHMENQYLPIYFNAAYGDSIKSKLESGIDSRLGSRLNNTVLTYLTELSDEAGIVNISEPVIKTARDSNLILSSLDAWSSSTNNLDKLIPLSFDNVLHQNFSNKSPDLLSRSVYKEDSLKDRLGNALRPKNSLFLTSNRLLLIYNHYINYQYYLFNRGAGLENSKKLPSFILNKSDLFSNYNFLQQLSSFVIRESIINDYSLSNPLLINYNYNINLFEKFYFSVENLSINLWTALFNIEKMLTPRDTNFDSLGISLRFTNDFKRGSFSGIANEQNTPVLSLSSDVLRYALHRPIISNVLGSRNEINSGLINQLLSGTGSDVNHSFYFMSLVNFEDYAFNFQPSIKELANKSQAYSNRSYYKFMGVYAANGYSLSSNLSDYSLVNLLDTSSRYLYNLLGVNYSSESYRKLFNNASLTQSTNLWSSSIDILNNNSNIQDYEVSLLPGFTVFDTVTDSYFSVNKSVNASQLSLSGYLPQSFSLNNKFFAERHDTTSSSSEAITSEINNTLFNNNKFLEDIYISDNNSFTKINLDTSVLFEVGSKYAHIYDSLFTIDSKSNKLVDNLPLFNSFLLPKFSKLLNTLPNSKLSFDSSNLGEYYYRELNTERGYSYKYTKSTEVGSVLEFSLKPWASAYYDSVDTDKPVRLSISKLGEQSNFATKLDSDYNHNIKFTSRSLFDWSMGWTNQTMTYSMPIYKLYRGAIARKPVAGYWSDLGSSNIEYDKFIWRGLFNQITKISKFNFVFDSSVKLNKLQPLNSRQRLLDNELIPFITNTLVALPNTFEEFDINYIYKYWTPEINTTRRSDHSSRFKITWNNFFSLNRDNLKGDSGLPNGPEFFSKHSTQKLLSDKIYAMNDSVNQYTSLYNLTPYFRPFSIDIYTNDSLYSFSPIINLLDRPVTEHFNNLENFESGVYSKSPISNLLKTTSYKYYNESLNNNSSIWNSLWGYNQLTQSYRQIDMFTSSSDTPKYDYNKFLLVYSSRNNERERLYRTLGLITKLKDVELGEGQQLSDTVLNIYKKGRSYETADSNIFTLFAKELVNLTRDSNNKTSYELLKSDIGSIRRLRVTKGICLPADLPIHLVCGSKDVIHSWAIPGLGVKIDCIPGYNSHRRVQFRWRGIFWGQCMEVCGRYHHWMPILVRIVHKDAFLSWCLSYLRALNSKNITSTRSDVITAATFSLLEDELNLRLLDGVITQSKKTNAAEFNKALIGVMSDIE